jgi:MFS family permease
MNDLVTTFQLNSNALGHLTSAVQFGFIIGTLVFALLTLADRYAPSKVFFMSALLAAIFNIGIIWETNSFSTILTFRFFTGFFLAGIYPVGMKISADYFEKGLGKSLGFLVGALVLGTAFPLILKGLTDQFSWKLVIITTSTLAILGGVLMFLLVPNGPYRKQSQKLNVLACFRVFKNPQFRAPAFGYFGHMWELYAFWAFVPIMLKTYAKLNPEVTFNIPILSFVIIGVGGLSCVISGYVSEIIGTYKTAFGALLLSGICCLLSPFMFMLESEILFVSFLIFWGMMVIADSPLFSTLVAQNAPTKIKGTALTIVNCIGFSITIISILIINQLQTLTSSNYMYMVLAIGPLLGLIAFRKKKTAVFEA